MGALTATYAGRTEFAGDYKIVKVTCIPASTSDTVTLTAATHGISEILYVDPKLTAGYDANLAGIFATYSGLVITVVTTAAAGTAATDWTGATAELLIIGR
jgi:hypothetical protein